MSWLHRERAYFPVLGHPGPVPWGAVLVVDQGPDVADAPGTPLAFVLSQHDPAATAPGTPAGFPGLAAGLACLRRPDVRLDFVKRHADTVPVSMSTVTGWLGLRFLTTSAAAHARHAGSSRSHSPKMSGMW